MHMLARVVATMTGISGPLSHDSEDQMSRYTALLLLMHCRLGSVAYMLHKAMLPVLAICC